MKFSKDMDEWYPSIEADLAVHVMGPELAGEWCVRLIDGREGRDEVEFTYSGPNRAEAMKYTRVAIRAIKVGKATSF